MLEISAPVLTVSPIHAELNLDYICDNPWIVIPCSALRVTNIDQVVTWLTKQAE
jgi:Arf/Sar family protein